MVKLENKTCYAFIFPTNTGPNPRPAPENPYSSPNPGPKKPYSSPSNT